MSILEAIILGIIQGATEFLPVSSSGHSTLVPVILGLSEPSLTEIAIAHQGTLLAVFVYFWKDIWGMIKATLAGIKNRKPFEDPESRLGWFIVAGTIPAAVIGLMFEDYIDGVLGTPRWAAFFLMGTAVLLIIGEYLHSGKKTLDKMSWSDAIIIGLAQMMALLPGISRSGSTITAGLALGLNRELAARYSFLLGIPVILGAGLLAVKDLLEATNLVAQLPSLFTVFAVSAVVGYACIHLLLQWVKDHSLIPFALYCWLFGMGYLAWSILSLA